MKGSVGRWLLPFLAGVVFLTVWNAAAGFWVLKRLEKRAETPLHGRFLPHPLDFAFTLQEVRLDWKEEFTVLSGTVRVQYDFASLVPGKKLRTRIRGRDLVVRLRRERAEFGGLGEVRINEVNADLAFPRKGPPEIYHFEVRSPELEFRLAREAGR